MVQYYDDTWIDYRFAWLNGSNMAIHFGFHDREHRGHSKALQNTNRVLADIAGVSAGERVLDAGCGIGGSSLWLARHRDAEVVGITLVPSQVGRARREAERQGSKASSASRWPTTRTPDSTRSPSMWYGALESLCHAPVKRAFYQEAERLLRPGGRLVVAEYFRTSRPLLPTMRCSFTSGSTAG